MIKLDVCKYCDRCPHFEPEVVERPRVDMLTSYSVCDMAERRMAITRGDTVVKCCNRERKRPHGSSPVGGDHRGEQAL